MKPPLLRNTVISAVAMIAATLSVGLLTSCSRDGASADTTGPPPVTTATPPGSPPPPTAQVDPATTPIPVVSSPPTSNFVEATVPAGSVLSDGKVTYTVAAGVNLLEVQESPEQTTFVVSDPSQNVVYFQIFDNGDPALNDLFEIPDGGAATDTELVLRDDAGVEVARVLLVDLAAARIAVDQSP